MPNAIKLTCRLIDLSLSGAAITTEQRPATGMLVPPWEGAGVVRHLEDWGCGRVTRLQHPDFLEESVCAP